MAHIKKEFNLSVDVINSASECVTGAQCKNQTRTIIVATTLDPLKSKQKIKK